MPFPKKRRTNPKELFQDVFWPQDLMRSVESGSYLIVFLVLSLFLTTLHGLVVGSVALPGSTIIRTRSQTAQEMVVFQPLLVDTKYTEISRKHVMGSAWCGIITGLSLVEEIAQSGMDHFLTGGM